MQIINPFTDIPAPIVEPNKPSGRNENMMSLSVGGGRRSLKVDGQGMYLGASNWKDAPFRVDMDGNTRMNNADIRGTISGRSTETIAKVINVNGEIVTGKLNTETGQILKDFTFAGYEGAFKSGNVSWNTNGEVTAGSGVLMNQNGIVGAKNGSATFAINSNGDATFAGTLSAPNGTLGSITAGNINGVTIKGSQIIGTTVKTAERGPRVELRRTHLLSYGSGQNPTFSTSERGIRMGYGNSDIAADIYVSRISSKYGVDAPVVYVGGILNPDNINCSGNLEAFAGSFTSLTVNGTRIDGSQLPSSTLKLVNKAGNYVTMETEGGQQFTIYATIGG